MYLTIVMDEAPVGFGEGNTIVISCLVDEKPPTLELVNKAILGYEGMELHAVTEGLQIGEAPQTGDTNRIVVWLALFVIAAGGSIWCYRKKKQ